MPDNVMMQVAQQVTKAPDFKNLYSNNVQLTATPFDIVFIFGENQALKDNFLIVEQLAKVTMSPQHAKVFSQLLADNIAKWEQTFGPIVVPKPPEAERRPS